MTDWRDIIAERLREREAAQRAAEVAAQRVRGRERPTFASDIGPVRGRQEGVLTAGTEAVGQALMNEAVRVGTLPKRMVEAAMVEQEVPGALARTAGEFTGTAAETMLAPPARRPTGAVLGARIGPADLGGVRDKAVRALVRNRRPPDFKPYTTEGETVAVPPPPIGHNAPPSQFKFSQYAEEYPAPGPPKWTYDKKKDEWYWAKEPTPEAEAFLKERDKIRADMKKKGYTPYFDPAARSDVDPTHYPANVETRNIMPAKQQTIEKDYLEDIGSPEARAALQEAYARGAPHPDMRQWYAMKQLEDEFIKELGPVEGRKAFRDRFATSMAATTGGADPTANLLMATYGNYLRANKLPLPEASHQYPVPIGGRYAAGNMNMFMKLMNEGGFPALGADNPKRHNFALDFMGHRRRPTMDEQMTSGMTPGRNIPPENKYGVYEQVLNEEAAKVGVDPVEFQEVAWGGFKRKKEPDYTGKPMIGHVNDMIERTHRLTGMPPAEIVRRGLVRGEIPLYGAAGAAVLPRVMPDNMSEMFAQDRLQQ
jgi:hypothetical protein